MRCGPRVTAPSRATTSRGDLAVIGAAVSATEGSVVLAAADLVAHDGAIASFAGPRVRTTVAAVQTARNMTVGAYGEPVLRERNMVVSVGTHQREVDAPERGVPGARDGQRRRPAPTP